MAPGESLMALSKQRYLDEVQRLQRRVQEMEHSGSAVEPPPGNGAPKLEQKPESDTVLDPVRPAATTPVSQVTALLGKGQTFLNLDQAEKALACFDEALAMDPDHLDALIKRGAALERLQRFDDAIAVYDRIIGLDGRQTTAYLLKGGVFNRMKRFNDALACYDQALKSQSQRKAP
jgi:tetratricopeptide (TPR) repeat protein